MIEFILIYISLSIIISIVSHLTEGFKGTTEISMICTLCVICVVLIPMSKAIPEMISNVKLLEIDKEVSNATKDYSSLKEEITRNIESSVAEIIESEYGIKAEVKATVDFDDMSAIRLKEIEITMEKNSNNAQIYQFVKGIYFCEVKIYEKR